MIPIKFRYIWKRTHDGHFYSEINPIECLDGGSGRFMGNPLWKLVARNLWMGYQDEDKQDIYEGDILAITTQDKQDILVVCRFGTIQRRMDTGFLCDITGFYFERSDGLNSLPIVKNYKGKHDLEMMQIVGNIYEHPNLLYTQSPTTE